MSNSFEQGWAAKPFKEQFPELEEKDAEWLDRLNHGITDMLMADLITSSQASTMRQKRFPKVVSRIVNAARNKQIRQP